MNSLRFLLAFSVSTLSVFALFAQNAPFLAATFEGASDNDIVYLSSGKDMRDSAFIRNGQARFSLAKWEHEWEAYFITYKSKEKRVDFFVFHNSLSDIKVAVDKEFRKWRFSGDKHASEQTEFYTGLELLVEQRTSLEKQPGESNNATRATALKHKTGSFEQQFRNYCVNWITKHKASPFSAAVIRMYINQSTILKALDTLAASCFDKLLPQAKRNNYEAFILQRELAKYSDAYSVVPLNKEAPLFAIKDTAGSVINLEKFRGKWLLIDFWASWCGPCRLNNPLLKEFHQKYKKNGLEVLSISVDTYSEKWKKAIVEDDMTWHQGTDLLGYEGGVGKAYQIFAVPAYFLLSPEGRIVTKSVGGNIQLIEKTLQYMLY